MMDCTLAREAISARIDGEREPVPPARLDDHLLSCPACRQWQASAVEHTQRLRRLAGRSQLAAVSPDVETGRRVPPAAVSWPRWALGAIGVVQLALAVAQGLGAHLGVSHHDMGGHVLNESTAWSAALGVAMVAAAVRPAAAAGLAGVLVCFVAVLTVYVVIDALAGRVTLDRALSHLPVVIGAVLVLLVWRRRPALPDPSPDRSVAGPTRPVELHRPADGRRPGSAA